MTSKNKRSLKNGYQYDSLIPKADLKTLKLSNFINVDETVQSMKMIVQQRHKDTALLAQQLKRNTIQDTCKAIFDFVYQHIQYTKDRAGFEEIRTPARTWADRIHGVDCDCYSVFIGSILYNLGIPFAFRVTKYSADWQHVYPIAYDRDAPNHQEFQEIDGEDVLVRTNRPKNYNIIDCVVDDNDYEVPYTDKKDYKMATLMLSGVDRGQYDYDTETSVMEDLAGLGRAKRKAKKKKKKAKKSSSKKAKRKTARATKKAAKKQKKATKKAAKKQKKTTKKKKGLFSKVKSKLKKGKEKRKVKRAVRKEKKAANPKKKGLFSKIRAKKKAKKEAKAAEKLKKSTPIQTSTPTIKIATPQKQVIEKDEFDMPEVDTPEVIEKPQEWISDDGETYNNQGSWGGDTKTATTTAEQDPFFDTAKLDNELKDDFADEMETTANQIKETGLTISKGAAMIKLPNDEEDYDDEGNPPVNFDEDEPEEAEEADKKGLPKVLDQALTYTKENPAIVAGVAVGVPVGIWGIGKIVKIITRPKVAPRSRKPVNGIDGLDGTKKKGKKKSKKSKSKTTTTSAPKTHSKAHRKHGRASFNGLK